MKIIFDHQIFYVQRFGGISRYISELASKLTNYADFDISIIAPFHNNKHLAMKMPRNIKNFYFPMTFRDAVKIQRLGRRLLTPLLYELNSNADIIHETYYSLSPIGRARCRIVTVYDMIYELFSEDFKSDGTTEAKRAAVARADHVICISESTRQDLIKIFEVDPMKTSVVHLGFSFSDVSPVVFPVKLPNGRPYILFVGNRWGYKNFDMLCFAYSTSPLMKGNYDLVAFGGGALSEDEISCLIKRGINKNVYQISGDDTLLASYYTGAALFVYPSLYEGFGIPPLEAMTFGCPVVCSNTGSIPEVVGNAGVYFDPSDVDSMREALEMLINDDSIKSTLVKLGYERLKNFSWDRCAAETSAIYRNTFLNLKENNADVHG